MLADGSCEVGLFTYGRHYSFKATTSYNARFLLTSSPSAVLGARPWYARKWFHTEPDAESLPNETYVVEHWLDDIDCGTLPFKSTAYGVYEGPLGSCMALPGALTQSEEPVHYSMIDPQTHLQTYHYKSDCSDPPANSTINYPVVVTRPSECQVQEYASGKLGSLMIYQKTSAPTKEKLMPTRGFGRFLNTEPAKPKLNAPTFKTNVTHFETWKMSSSGEPTFTVQHYIGDVDCGANPMKVLAYGSYTGTFSSCLPIPASLTGTPSTVFWIQIAASPTEGEVTLHYESTCGLPMTGMSPIAINISSSECQRQEYKSGRVGSIRLSYFTGNVVTKPPPIASSAPSTDKAAPRVDQNHGNHTQ